jgi:L-threonylcarbamoyladenylate synthase
MEWNNKNLVDTLKNGGVAVMPTDTIYGIVGLAENVATVNRIYNLKKRNPEKPCIILIGDLGQLQNFSINLSEEQRNKLKEFWFTPSEAEGSGPVSVIFDCPDKSFSYLHRGTKTLAFRLPAPQDLRSLILKIGPLIAPSANPDGLPPAENIPEAKKYFDLPAQSGNSVDFYLDGGKISGKASRIIKLHKDGTIDILRE